MVNPAPIDVLMANPPVVNISDITDGTASGAGVFDSLMRSVGVHLNDQLAKGRINGTDFSSVYLEALKHTMSVSVELSLAKQKQAYELELLRKQSLLADEEIKSAKLSQENAKKQNRLIERQTILTDAQTDLIHFDLNTRFPAEVANTLKQGVILDKQSLISDEEIKSAKLAQDNAKKQNRLIERQTILADGQMDLIHFDLNTKLPAEVTNTLKQGVLLDKQVDVSERTMLVQEAQSVASVRNTNTQTALYEQKRVSERAQTDETVIGTGSLVDEQRLLVREQRLGFERDNMHKVAKVYADNWLARYTEQPGDTFAPDANLNDENAKQVMAKLLASLGLTPIAPAPAPAPPPATP